MIVARAIAGRLILATCAVACAAHAAPAPALTAIVLGPDPIAADVRGAIAARPAVHLAALPEPVAAAGAGGEVHAAAIAAARKAYVDADFPRCRAALAPIDPLALLDGQRATAARVLVWRVACAVGEGNRDAARRDAAAIAAAGLELPADIASVTPDVEALIADAAGRAASAPTTALRVAATTRGPSPSGARVSVDGRADGCAAPCTLMLAPGAHLIGIVADGFAPAARTVRAPDDRELTVELAEAAAPVVAAQLQLRIARGVPVDDPRTLALATRAVRARRVAVLGIDALGERTRIVGALAVDERIVARAERIAARPRAAAMAAALLDELVARSAPEVALWRRPWFWISVGTAAALTGGITAYALFRPDPTSRVVFP